MSHVVIDRWKQKKKEIKITHLKSACFGRPSDGK